MRVPLLDLKAQYASIKDELDAAVAEVVESQYFVLGPKVTACEEAIAQHSGCAYGIGISSGTDALLVCLMAEDVGPGDEVITTPYSFFATAGVIARLGATPVFVDVDPVSYNLDPNQIEEKITERTKILMPVHLYGQMADMDPIMEIARRHDLVVIEDAAQAIGAEYDGRRACSIGDYGCLSFFPSKNLGGFGDAGMVVTNDRERAERVATLRVHGGKQKYFHEVVGGNFRLDALQAAVVHAKLPWLDEWTAGRQTNAARYDRLFTEAGVAGDGGVGLPVALPGRRHIFNQYIIRVDRRDELKAHLQEAGVATAIYYPLPLHAQECFAYLGQAPGTFPRSETAARETLALPIYPELSDDQAEYVVKTIAGFIRANQNAG